MFDNPINAQFLPFILISFLGGTFIVQIGFYWLIFNRLIRFKHHLATPNHRTGKQPVSVVICAHNAWHQLKENLPVILEQDYPEFEVLVVNHSSDDDTRYLLTDLGEKYPHLTTLHLQEDLNFFSGKKFPLSIGIKSARYELVLLTDADCRPVSKNWITLMQSAFREKTEVVLGYGPYQRKPGLLNMLIRFDTAHIALQYLSFALAGIPYMGVGRNLSYKKQLFFKNNGFISHYRIRSGDDDLFINRVARKSTTSIMVEPDSFILSEPKLTLGQWITQKRRHLSTSTYYKTGHKFLLALYALSSFLFYALFITMLSLNWSPWPVLGLVLLRFGSQYYIVGSGMKRLGEQDLIFLLPLYEVMILLLGGGMMIVNLFQKPVRWK